MKITRKRYVVMRKNRTEIWCGLAQNYKFKKIDEIGETQIKTYRTKNQAMSSCSSWDEDIEAVEVIETFISTDHPTEKVCTGKRCPMQVGYNVTNCKDKDCIYRTETEKGGAE